MSYSITITSGQFEHWNIFEEYLNDNKSRSEFGLWLLHNNPDVIISAAWDYIRPPTAYYIEIPLHITFKSEAHYTWFLLQQ